MLIYGLSFVLSLLISLYLTPVVREAAEMFKLVDRPDGMLKRHRQPIPYLGGVSVYVAVLVSLALTFEFDKQLLGLLLGGTLILLLGLIDDLGSLSPYAKLAGELIAALVLVKSGIKANISFLPQWVSIAFSLFWIVLITNSINIIDVMDGLASGVAVICFFVFFYVALVNQRAVIAIVAVSMAGALLGFLRFNFEPAKIYLGDAGSLFIGCMLGSLSLIGEYTSINRIGLFAPVVILGVPLFDTFFVSYIRWKRGMPVFFGSPDHFALRLRKWRLSTRQTVLCSYGLTILLGVAAVVMIHSSDMGALGVLVGVVLFGMGLGMFLKKIDMTM
jgi:UDP-GlcNAc:undecaprenyl-phosphate GlcNAc-1-phosphate transferase